MKVTELTEKVGQMQMKVVLERNLYNRLMEPKKLEEPHLLNKTIDLHPKRIRDIVLVSKLQIMLHFKVVIKKLVDHNMEAHKEEEIRKEMLRLKN